MMSVLEGLRKHNSLALINDYFERLTVLFNNGDIHDHDGNSKLLLSDRKLEPISLSNINTRKFVKTYELLFDFVFENHLVGFVGRNMLKDYITDKFSSVIGHRVDFTDDDIIELKKFDIFYDLLIKLCGKDGLKMYPSTLVHSCDVLLKEVG